MGSDSARVTDGATGNFFNGPPQLPALWDKFLYDETKAKHWDQMNTSERVASAINTGNLSWDGVSVSAGAQVMLGHAPELGVFFGSGTVAGSSGSFGARAHHRRARRPGRGRGGPDRARERRLRDAVHERRGTGRQDRGHRSRAVHVHAQGEKRAERRRHRLCVREQHHGDVRSERFGPDRHHSGHRHLANGRQCAQSRHRGRAPRGDAAAVGDGDRGRHAQRTGAPLRAQPVRARRQRGALGSCGVAESADGAGVELRSHAAAWT